jgi:hypothetical protein
MVEYYVLMQTEGTTAEQPKWIPAPYYLDPFNCLLQEGIPYE